ncbi:MAG: glucose 1-dehydrogenase [Limnochordales bacterium]|nr:glucose 1-dehydrogenase [Limnochordales bacterium]
MAAAGVDLTGQCALVVGGSRGIGHGVALALARAGATVGVTSRRQEAADAAAATLNDQLPAPRVSGWAADVTDVAGLRAAVAACAEKWGRLDIVVNSAGVAGTELAIDLEESDWDAVLDTNLKGAFFAAQAAARIMRDQGGGRIINIASVFGYIVRSGVAPYCASKAGLIHLTRALALEWARFGVLINAVAPGYVLTDMNRDFLSQPQVMDRLIKETPLRRLAAVGDVADAVLFLSSPQSQFITGQVIVVDGGWTLR